MILVLCGNQCRLLEKIRREIAAELASRAVMLDIGYLTSKQSRLNRLEIELGRGTFGNNIKVIFGINDQHELQLLRESGATIAHVYGAMGKVYNCINIEKKDYFVGSNMDDTPSHVLSVKELISEIEIKQQLTAKAKHPLSSPYTRLMKPPHHRA